MTGIRRKYPQDIAIDRIKKTQDIVDCIEYEKTKNSVFFSA